MPFPFFRRHRTPTPENVPTEQQHVQEQINPTYIASSPTQEDWLWGKMATGSEEDYLWRRLERWAA